MTITLTADPEEADGMWLVAGGPEAEQKPSGSGATSYQPSATSHMPAVNSQQPVVSSPLLVVDQVSKAFVEGPRPLRALERVSLHVEAGELVCLLGPSGSGKSTLLRMIGGLAAPDTGTVYFGGELITAPHPAIGFVFQRTNLMPWRTVMDNVLLPVEVQQGRVSQADRQQAQRMIRSVGLEGFEAVYPKHLSGGMAQRVVLARALLQQPRLLLMDEPFGALDALTRERMNVELLRLHALREQTVLMVTHSIPEAVFLADRVLVLSKRPGRVVAEVSIDLSRPRETAVMGSAEFGRLTQQVRQHIDAGDGEAGRNKHVGKA
jgi:NitT/TauT family transport system ATP-binding protein